MKKISTLLALSCLMVSSAVAAVATPHLGDFSGKKIVTTAAQRQKLNTMRATAEYDAMHQTNQDQYITRTWTNPNNGNVYTMQFNKEQSPLCELIGFEDNDGNKFNYEFEQLPLYCCTYTCWITNPNGEMTANFSLQLCWPSYYIWNQVFDYDGPLDSEGDIPLEDRNYACVTPDDLMNSTTWCRKFQESTGIGGKETADRNNWEYFTCLPNELLGFTAMYNGELAVTEVTAARASFIEFKGYKEDGNIVDYRQVVYLKGQSGKSYIERSEPQGGARVEGFNPRHDILPEFGDIHLFNMGLGGHDIYGENDAYPDAWGPLSQFYIVAADKYIQVYIPEDMKAFDSSKIQTIMGEDFPSTEDFDSHANVVKGVIYADAKYSNDTSLNPTQIEYNLLEPEIAYDPIFEMDYLTVTPVPGSFVAYGVGLDGIEDWSEKYGVILRTFNFVNFFGNYAKMGFGTKDGYQFNCQDYYGNIVSANSTGNCVYHYDPKDVTKTRSFSLIGNMEYDSVEVVVADNATVNAADGVINVTVAEDSNVGVFAISGAVVANGNVKAGNSLNVAADKGVYVVVVNGKATKVAL
ncbi:MAG: hypothetical protein K2H86_06715 [Muribaculaceae bacterium]|nr:hypothetical protein [Muribaculaceae bacterium]